MQTVYCVMQYWADDPSQPDQLFAIYNNFGEAEAEVQKRNQNVILAQSSMRYTVVQVPVQSTSVNWKESTES